jgi:xylose isomerase
MLGMVSGIADRFHRYQESKDLADRLAMVQRVRGADGIEIVYPGDFGDNVEETVKMVKDTGLTVSAVNLNVKSQKKWQTGSFTANDSKVRAEAAADMKFAMDLAAEFGASMITCCPLIDGHNYAFQRDYLKQWGWLETGIAEAAKHRNDIRISLEYKLNESSNYCTLGDMGRTLYLCERVGEPHVGVTMDVGHALIAKEAPAEVMSVRRWRTACSTSISTIMPVSGIGICSRVPSTSGIWWRWSFTWIGWIGMGGYPMMSLPVTVIRWSSWEPVLRWSIWR